MKTLMVLFSLLLGAAAQAAIYRVIDAQGNITFTDEEPKQGDRYEQVELPPVNVVPMSAPGVVVAPSNLGISKPPAVYRAFAITSPANDSAVRENAGNVDVTIDILPALNTAGGHRLVILMDGVPVAQGSVLGYRLVNVDRGTHQLQAEVRAISGERIAQTDVVTFTLQRISILSPAAPHPTPPPPTPPPTKP